MEAVIEVLQHGIPVARIELLDSLTITCVNAFSKTSFPEEPTLFLEFHATSPADVEQQSNTVQQVVRQHGATRFESAADPEKRALLWKARHDVYYAQRTYFPGRKGLVTDVCVPISQLGLMVTESRRLLDDAGVAGPFNGHVGDGNFHAYLVYEGEEGSESFARAKAAADRMAGLAVSLGGSCTGEHGIGRGKRGLMQRQFSPSTLGVMRAIKHAFDPRGIMNPGKVLPDIPS